MSTLEAAAPSPPEASNPARLGPLSASQRLALDSVKQLDVEAFKRVVALRKQFVAAVEAEEQARAARWIALLDAARERLGPLEVPPGHGVREVVDGDQTFLELAPVPSREPAHK